MAAGAAPVRTFLIADIRGYTRFTQQHGDEAAARLASTFADVVGATVADHDGSLIELRGDEALVVFASARQAFRAAVAIQRRCREPADLGPILPLGIGIGIDSGEAVPLDGGGYRGGALNLAARLCAVAGPGEVLASGGATHLAGHVEGLRFEPRRAERLKGLSERVRAVRVVPEEPLPPLPKPPAPPPRSNNRIGLAAIVAAAVVAAAVLTTVLARSGGSAADALAANSAGLLTANGDVVTDVPLAGRPAGVAVGAGAVWITDSVNGTLLRVAPDKGVVVDRIPVGRNPSGIAVGDGSIWVANSEEGTVSRVNPSTGEVVDTIAAGNGPTSTAYGADTVWVLNVVDATVSAIAPASGETTTIQLGQNPTRLAFGLGAVWVTSAEAGVLLRLDPGTKTVVRAIAVGNGPVGVAARDGAVWVANPPDRTVSRVDPESGAVTKIALPGSPTELAATGADVWASNTLAGTVSVIDAAAARVRRTLTTRSGPTALAPAAGRVWALALASARSHRGGTLHVVSQGDDNFDTIDPGAAFRTASWQALSIVYDGLLTYRRSGGPSGQEIVPDLASALPVVQDGGRTYVFQLRAGIRYSDGTAVKASDIRRALEREFRAGTGLSYELQLPGADHCSRRRCDLSRAVVADDAAGTVVFHLAAADPDFLFRLALPPGAAVAKGAPPIDDDRRPLPATGPYRIARYVPNRSLVLTRNPYFHEWSPEAQPGGYPDRIVYRLGVDRAAGTTAVERNRADLMVDSPPSGRLREIETRFPDRAHVFVEPTVIYLYLDTRRPPFDDVRVRRALNFATDRAELVRLWGGHGLARPTCQVLPPGIAGYRPYCPYTAGPSAAGNWRAPDLSQARALLRKAEGAQDAVTVLTNGDDPARVATARYFVGLLNRLGYTARLRTYPDVQTFYEHAGKPTSPGTAGVQGWESNFPRASNFFPGLLACAAYQPDAQVNLGAAGFCDKTVDHNIKRAQALAATDPAASAAIWARVDRSVVDGAPWIAFLDRAGVDLTSARVGNYQRHQQFSVLLDQLWVR